MKEEEGRDSENERKENQGNEISLSKRMIPDGQSCISIGRR
jgi:hypothetical protein